MTLKPLWAVLGGSQGLCWRSWAALGASVGGLELLSGPMWEMLGCLGASVGGLGSLLGPLWAVLGRSRGFCGRSWTALGTSVGGLGWLSGPP